MDQPQHHVTVDAVSATVTFGRELDEHEQQAIADAVTIALGRIEALAETAPHPVHVKPEWAETKVKTYDRALGNGKPAGTDEQGPFWELTERVQSNRPLACPDCGRGLIAGNAPGIGFDFLACPRIPAGPLVPADRPCHEGCLVACGQES